MRLHGEIESLGSTTLFPRPIESRWFYDNEDIGFPQMRMLQQMVKAQQIQAALYFKKKTVFISTKAVLIYPHHSAIKNIVIVHGGVNRKSVSSNEKVILLVHLYRSLCQRYTFNNQQQIFSTHRNIRFISFGQFQKIGSICILALKKFW